MDTSQTLDWYGKHASELETKIKSKGGIAKHEMWRLEYYRSPYLLLVGEEELRQRFIDLHSNVLRLNEAGQLIPDQNLIKGDDRLFQNWTQAVEAWKSRGGLQGDLVNEANGELSKYFEKGEPIGVGLFNGLPLRQPNTIVKFSRKEFLEPMLTKGLIRLAPASFYSQGSLLKSMKDLELERQFRIPAFNEALSGQTHLDFHGANLPIQGGAISVVIKGQDYFLLSTCLEFDRRMPTDFGADAALIVRDERRFVAQFKKSFKAVFGQSYVEASRVHYYDPFRLPTQRFLKRREFLKHFAYAYQKEHRIVARPITGAIPKEPLFLEIGSL